MDYSLGFMKDGHLKERIKLFEDTFWPAVETTSQKLCQLSKDQKLKSSNKKEYIEWMKQSQPPESHTVLLLLYDKDGDPQDTLLKYLKRCLTGKHFETAR